MERAQQLILNKIFFHGFLKSFLKQLRKIWDTEAYTRGSMGAQPSPSGPAKSMDFRGFSCPNECWAPCKVKSLSPPWTNSWIPPGEIQMYTIFKLYNLFLLHYWSDKGLEQRSIVNQAFNMRLLNLQRQSTKENYVLAQ